jgi:small subunit ribosomal protein S19e
MAKAYDIPATELITRLAEHLRNDKKIQPPQWAAYVKTGAHAEKIPQNRDWWYTRCASIIRKIYLHGPTGVSDLKSEYGGRKRIGYNLDHHKDAGGAIIRKALQQLIWICRFLNPNNQMTRKQGNVKLRLQQCVNAHS